MKVPLTTLPNDTKDNSSGTLAEPTTKAEEIMALRERKVLAMSEVFDRLYQHQSDLDAKIKDWIQESKDWMEFSKGLWQ